MGLFMIGNGLSSPAALGLAMEVNPRLVGSATGLLWFVQLVVGSLCTALASIGTDPAFSALLVMTAATRLSGVILGIALRRG